MKKNILIIFYIAVLLLFNQLSAVQKILSVQEEEVYINKIDVYSMTIKLLPEYKLEKKDLLWNRGRRYFLKKENTREFITITVGLHSSRIEAEKIAKEYLNEISINMIDKPVDDIQIGDKLWWWSSDGSPSNIKNIVFLRYNALFIINASQNYILSGKDLLIELAKKIDNDILKRESYLSIESYISVPSINMITTEKTKMKKNENTIIKIIAANGESIEFQSLPGLNLKNSNIGNEFLFTASEGNVTDSFYGDHTIKFVAINENNVVSDVSELRLTIVR